MTSRMEVSLNEDASDSARAESKSKSKSKSRFNLSFAETRVLGSLIEKEATTPDYYPMTLNGLQQACNQKSNRYPVSALELATIEEAVEELRRKDLAVKLHLAGSRMPKYKHVIENRLHLQEGHLALLCVLMLRGVQTAGELNQRTERLHRFEGVSAVDQALQSLIDFPYGALVRRIPAGSGRRVETFGQLLSAEVSAPQAEGENLATAEPLILEEEASWRRKLENELATLKGELAELRAAFEVLRNELE